MYRRSYGKPVLYVVVAVLTLAGAMATYLAASRFTYYDNGVWVVSSLWTVYARSLAGYGRNAIEERRLGPEWGGSAGYAARNSTLDLVGLDYSLPLAWEDIAAGPGLWVMRPTLWDERREVALYPSPGITVAPGEKVCVTVQIVGASGLVATEGGAPFDKAYSLTLYRPRFSSVAYVVEIRETEPGKVAASVTATGAVGRAQAAVRKP